MLKTLLKKQLTEFWFGLTVGKKGEKSRKNKSKIGFVILYVFCFISLCFAFFGMSTLFIDAVLPTGELWLFYSLMVIAALAFAVVGSAFSAYTSLYNARDNELLLSLPIPPVYLLIVRMVTVYMLGMIFEAVVMLPAMVQYWINVGPTVMNVIAPIIVLIAIGFIALTLSCFMGWVIGLIASKVKNKNTVTVIVSLVLIGGYYIFYFNIQKILGNIVANLNAAKFKLHLFGSACTGEILPLIAVVLIAAILFALTCIILSKSFIKIVTRKTATKRTEYVQDKVQQKNSVKKALLLKELKRFTGSAVYMLNCALGSLLMPAAGVILIIKAKDLLPLLDLVPEGFLEAGVLAATIMVAGMNFITAPSISLEGNSFWVARSLPINSYDILEAKIKLHELITLPPAIIMAVMMCIALKVELNFAVIICGCVYIAVIVCAQFGLVLNLKMPKLEWTNEAVPVKRDLPCLIAMFGVWIAAVVLFGAFYLLRNLIDFSTFSIVVLVALAFASRLLGKWLRTNGVELLEAIPA